MKKFFFLVLACLMVLSLSSVCFAADAQPTEVEYVQLSEKDSDIMPRSYEWGTGQGEASIYVTLIGKFVINSPTGAALVKMMWLCRPVTGVANAPLSMKITSNNYSRTLTFYADGTNVIKDLGALENGEYNVAVSTTAEGNYAYAWTAYTL